MLGDHSYTGKLGDIEINPANAMTYNNGIYSTTLGAGAYNSGSLAAVTGALSIASGEDTKNTGATIYGSMNSIESATSNSSYSGVASSVLGFANKTQNANAALIWGTGNEITNSVESIDISTNWNNVSVAEAQQKAIEAMQSSKYAGGSVMAIGGGNKADYAKYSQLTGVQNKVTGTEAKAAKYDFVNGYQNTVTNASDVTVIGIKNEVTADGNKVIGDNHKVSGKDNVIFGSADQLTETTVNNAVVLGHNAKVTGEGGVALGFGSVADRANAVSVGSKGAERQIINVKAGVDDTDAVNVSQLKEATANANKGWKLSTEDGAANQVASEATVNFSGKKDAGGHQNITVSNEGNNVKIELASELKNVTGVINGNSRVTLGTGIAGITNGQASVVMMNGSTTINGVVGIDNTGKISGVANGEADKDAVNYGQLKDVKAEALKHSTVTNGDNITVTPEQAADGRMQYNVALKNDITLAGDDPDAFVSISGSRGTIWASGGVTAGSVAAGDVFMDGATATVSGLSNKTTAYEGFATTGKAATEEQLKEVATEAGKHSKVVNGNNTNVEETTVDGQKVYKVNLNNNVMVGDVTGKYVSISGTNGTVEATGAIATKDRVYADKGAKLADIDVTGNTISNGASSIVLDGSDVKVNDKVTIDQNGNIAGANHIQTNALNAKYNLSVGTANENGTVPFFVNSNGAFYAANGKLVVDKDGKLVAPEAELGKVTADEGVIGNVVLKDGVFYKHTALRDGELFVGDADGNYSQITTKGAKLGKVTIDKDGKISGVAAGAVTADSTDAVNGSQLHAVATEAGKHSKVVNGSNINVEEFDNDGQKIYKVNLNKDIILGDLTGKYVNISGTNGTIETTGYIATQDRVYADKGGKLADIDVTGNKISNGASSIVLDGSNVKVNDKVTIDQNGNIAGANHIQTNALNAKYNLSVGTANADGTVPFFVNSNGAFYAANGKLVVDKEGKLIAPEAELGKVTADEGVIGNVVLKDGVFYKHTALRDGELFVGDADGNYSQITTKGAKLGQVVIAADGKISNVAAGVADTDAVNVGQLKEAVEAGNTDTHIKPGEYGVGADNKVNMDVVDKNGNKVDTVTIKDVAKASDVGDVNNIASDIKNGEGHTTVVDAVNNLNNKVGDLQYSKVEKGEIADGDSTTTAIGKLDQKLTDVAATAAKHTTVTQGDNITVTKSDKPNENGGENYNVALNKDIKLDSVTTGDTVMNNNGVKVGTDVSLNKDGLKVGDKVSVSATAVTAGQTSINNDGLAVGPNTSLKADELKVDGKTYIDKNGLNANGMQITNVADGKENSDAVNVGQLKESEKTINNRIDGVENQVVNNTNRINKLGSRVNKVGAGAAALAALHPMDFDPDDKLTFSAGYGNYAGENAAAIGAYYRPDEKVMFSVAGTVGNGENMVNAGVSFALDRTNHVSNSRTALAREVIDLRGQLAVMGAKMAKMEKAFGMLDETKTKLFPDVPANHWAYEYIAKLAGNGYIEGYPDGNFGGDRLMTRYEFAAMLYRAIENGAALEEKIIKEFEPELGRIRVDRISGEDGDRDKIERVRVNDTKGERDHYGNKLAK